jgi:hypothetical protein
MVAEVDLYFIIYENCTDSSLDLPKVQEKLREWKRQWNFVLGECKISQRDQLLTSRCLF